MGDAAGAAAAAGLGIFGAALGGLGARLIGFAIGDSASKSGMDGIVCNVEDAKNIIVTVANAYDNTAQTSVNIQNGKTV